MIEKIIKLKENFFERSFWRKISSKTLSIGVLRNDNRQKNLKFQKKILYERSFSHKIKLETVSTGEQRNVK